MSDKKKCQYFEKCYRKDKNHLAEYLHPRDLKAAAADKTDVKPAMRKEKTVELKDEEVPVKTSLRKRKTHEMSVYDDDTPAEPPAKRVKREKSKTSADKEPAKEDTAKSPTPASEPSPSTSKSPSPGAGKRMRCKYWDKCYRKDKGHKALYVHPGDPDEKQAEKFKEGVAGRTRTAARPKPLHHMDSIDSVLSGGMTLKRTGSVYACTCEEYKGSENFGKAENMKTCSHLVKYLGEDFERVRCELPEKGKKAHIPQHVKISVLLAHKYKDGETNPTNWWMSEKLDGVRAYWNGRCFYSRLGNAFYAPSWFTKDLPKDMHLDGELFGGRKKFQSTVSIVKTPEHPKWNTIKYCVFDAPHLEKEPFEKRMKAIQDQFEKVKPAYAKFVDHEKCRGTDHVDKELARIIALGGEGLMIRKPGSKYERTRSTTLLKIKKFHDAEAIVIGYEPSKSNPGLTGALWVKMACGKKFKVGSGLSNKDRRSPPKKGTIITYKFQELTNSGSPRFPSYVGIRIDMTEPKDAEGVVMVGNDDE
ncbi:uncharacterized protein LOC128242258 [Mya arenaria]|uniref:uncharacterized protein LOC128242258 n=1 Tax=Mya arenaria TaxID=6604 RepID=UPI0022E7128F|nr:uncharacterized protein LOC128242258 [Mya arenaria]